MGCSKKNIGEVGAGRAAGTHGNLMLPKERDNDVAHNSADQNTDLITGLSEDVVLGEVVPRLCKLSWNERPLLRLVNRSWKKSLEERFPMYHQRFHNHSPNIFSNTLILSHIKKSSEEALYRLVGLWLCRRSNKNANVGDNAVTVRLPEHPLVEVPKYTKFVCDNHHVFSLAPSFVTEETQVPLKLIYNVWMLDLRDFNIHWKKLPPLPRLGKCVYASSSLNGDGDESSYIWQRRRSDSSEAEGWKLSALNCEWHWDYFNVNTRPPTNISFDTMSDKLPLYVETEQLYIDDVMKTLFRRCSIPQYTVHKNNIFMLLDGNTSDYKFCFIIVEGGGICILNMALIGERTRIVEEQEWNEFVVYWNDKMRGQGKYEKPNKWHLHSHPQEQSAIKVFLGVNQSRRLQKLELTEKADDEIIEMDSTVRVSQKGPIYGYSFLCSRFETLT